MACVKQAIFFDGDSMKSIVITLLAVLSVSLQAANEGNQSTLIGRAQSAIASKDQPRIDEQLTLIASHPDADAPQAMHLLLDAGANGNTQIKKFFSDDLLYKEEWNDTPLINAVMSCASKNIAVLREWSEAHGNVIDPNCSGNQCFRWSLLGRIIQAPSPHSQALNKIPTIQALLQFSNIDVDKPFKTGLSPLHELLQKMVTNYYMPQFETNLAIVKILIAHGATVTEPMIQMIERAGNILSPDHIDQTLNALRPGSALKAARAQ